MTSDEPDYEGVDVSDLLVLPGRMDAAWRSFTATLEARFPAADWPNGRLLAVRQELLESASDAALAGSLFEGEGRATDATSSYTSAAERRADATEIGVLLATRGVEAGEGDLFDMMRTFDRVLSGEGPERRIVTTRGPDGANIDAILEDEESDRMGLALWERAARYIEPRSAEAPYEPLERGEDLTEWIGEQIAREAWEQDIDFDLPGPHPDEW